MSPDTAIEYAPGPVERRAFDQMRASGVIREAHPAHYWFDLDRMGQDRRRTRNPKARIAIVLAVLMGAALIWMIP
ncbi:hypothetical protein FPZ54_09780 [Sphingomonas suaedae]|uniref:Uncharacterized protein n=1 Tax=Sphingomonas suaedae TaxID=2599297 RepID=A0A518RFV6_9SPHN|nr:hypothetical protein FPZ54_09780 [Sphingomonas suaedae]